MEIGRGVQTSSGMVVGHASMWKPEVSEYLGIPYAMPPVENRRFAAPEKFMGNGTFMADRFTMASPELVAYGAAMGGGTPDARHIYAEDCLSVNVWTKPQTGEKSKAVLLWIYGGGKYDCFSSGTSNAPFYNGARFADEHDVVVVSFNYRINIFGFPNAPGLPDQNVGLLDQRMAVEWARDNIAAFGGDPKRITLFGESAGGASVDYYAFAWPEDPVVAGFIAQSGTAAGGIARKRNMTQDPYANWYMISEKMMCGGAEAGPERTLECMRGKPADQLMNTVAMSGFGPFPDNKTIYGDMMSRFMGEQFAKKPLLVGNNDNEPALFQLFSMGKPAPMNDEERKAEEIGFSCPSGFSAAARRMANVPAWRYRYMGVWQNTALAPDMGAYHSAEIPLVFGATEQKPGASMNTPEEEMLSMNMMTAWAMFAKDPERGLSSMGWPMYDPAGDTLIRLGFNNMSKPDFAAVSMYDADCAAAGFNMSGSTSSNSTGGSNGGGNGGGNGGSGGGMTGDTMGMGNGLSVVLLAFCASVALFFM
ncbi:alpha/beta-hydrolase [Aulographum hederae CBS 113979]|uniref:Carboxylic ester hydrolase n=1 Tax=Aulographum hederae CBS 113979 TaxID=1176131 RepID=A0A6G1H2R8_9PEZI|nr:alpha/beta-hydrolase [Aulographum hederae CBS 113979]